MKFTGDLEELKARLAGTDGEWTELNPNQVQFRDRAGAIMNWYPSTGTINFQGRSKSAEVLKALVAERLIAPGNSGLPQQAESQGNDLLETAESGEQEQRTPVPELGFDDSELVLGLVAATGTDLDRVAKILEERLQAFRYKPEVVKISRDIIPVLRPPANGSDHCPRTNQLMDAGNELRRDTGDHSVLALAVCARILDSRRADWGNDEPGPLPRRAFIVTSLKHPEEVHRLRGIYSTGFFLIGVHADEKRRFKFLTDNKQLSEEQAQQLMDRDAEETESFGQHTRDTFHLSDFFISLDDSHDKLQGDLWRVLDLIFGRPYVTPTFDEYAMFMAFSAALRSADLSRQVGAVVAQQQNIVATGANDVPQAGGGLYWPSYNKEGTEIEDRRDGRDYMRGFDSNAKEKRAMIDEITAAVQEVGQDVLRERLYRSRLSDITEYGRMVHAEMEAILACSRTGVSTQGGGVVLHDLPVSQLCEAHHRGRNHAGRLRRAVPEEQGA